MGGMYHCEHGEYSTHGGFQCDECDKEKPAPPEVPAPDEPQLIAMAMAWITARDKFPDITPEQAWDRLDAVRVKTFWLEDARAFLRALRGGR